MLEERSMRKERMNGNIIAELDRFGCQNSPFENELRTIKLEITKDFMTAGKITPVRFRQSDRQLFSRDHNTIARRFPKIVAAGWNYVLEPDHDAISDCGIVGKMDKKMNVAILFSGGPAAGGHNVIAGVKRALGDDNKLYGVNDGPKGLLRGEFVLLDDKTIEQKINTGGFDLLGTDRMKIKTTEQMLQLKKVCHDNGINAIIVVGGDDSNTNAAVIAEYLFNSVHDDGSGVLVIGVPKTMDGDVQRDDLLPISFGFSTATRIYAEATGNILQDACSSKKYWHFIKLMGRTASQVTLEVALQTRPHVTLISEEIAENKSTLSDVIEFITTAVIERSKKGMDYGVVLVPEGLLEAIIEMRTMIDEIDAIYGTNEDTIKMLGSSRKKEFFIEKMTTQNRRLYESLPQYIKNTLVADRDSHGNLTVSQIQTEKLLADMVDDRIRQLAPDIKFASNTHFFGYEGRCGAPTAFDAMLGYNLGLVAGSLVLNGRTGYMASITDFNKGGRVLGIPLAGILDVEEREGKDELVIQKALVNTQDPAFKYLKEKRDLWRTSDTFCSPGPRQYYGKSAKQLPFSVAMNRGYNSVFYDNRDNRSLK